jgi:hypothetical protein
MKVQWATASSPESPFPKQRPPLKSKAGPSRPIASRRGGMSAEFNFQRRIEKTDRMYTELLHSRSAE